MRWFLLLLHSPGQYIAQVTVTSYHREHRPGHAHSPATGKLLQNDVNTAPVGTKRPTCGDSGNASCSLRPQGHTQGHTVLHRRTPGSWTHKPSCTRIPQPEPRKGPRAALSRCLPPLFTALTRLSSPGAAALPPHSLSTRGPGFALAQRSSALLQGSPVGPSASPGPPLTALPGGPGQDGSPSWGKGPKRGSPRPQGSCWSSQDWWRRTGRGPTCRWL